MFFVRMSEGLGFLVRMIYSCIIQTFPMIVCYFMFLSMFTLSMIVLDNEVASDIATDAVWLSLTQKHFL